MTEQADVEHWRSVAEDWTAWARTPDHDAFWAYRAALAAFVGPGAGEAVEIGCGEGRIARLLGALGYRTTVVEPVEALLAAAREQGSAVAYHRAPATALLLQDDSADLVMMYNMLMDVEAMDAAVAEAARVLRPGGRLIAGVVHPIADLEMAQRRTGDWAGMGPYFDTRFFDEHVMDRNGLAMRFRGWARPLSAYVAAIADAGLAVTRMEEPRPAPDHPWAGHDDRWRHLPLFLWLEARPTA